MVRVVLDTSVLVSAFLTPAGVAGTLLQEAENGAFLIYISSEILAEMSAVLSRSDKLKERYVYDDAAADAFIKALTASATLVSNLPEIDAVKLDPADNAIVAAAVKADAHYLVSGDSHLLSLGDDRGIRIVAPREFHDLLMTI